MPLAQRFSVNTPVAVGPTAGANLSQKDIFPIQPVSKGTGVDDEKLTLQQIQAIPYGAASLSGTTYNVTFSNYPTDFNPVIGQTIIIKFNNAKAGTDALNLSINGQLIPMLMQGEAITEIAANQIIEFTMIGNIVNGTQTITHANASAGVTAAKVNNQINGALANYPILSELTSLIDPETLTKSGFYFVTQNNNKMPVATGLRGELLVRYIADGIRQLVFFERSGTIYSKTQWGGSWGNWVKVVTESELSNCIKNYLTTIPSGKKLVITHNAGIFSSFIQVQGSNGAAYLSISYQGYGIGTSIRDHIGEILKGSNVSYAIVDNKLELYCPNAIDLDCSVIITKGDFSYSLVDK